jgi:hypothetical protein
MISRVLFHCPDCSEHLFILLRRRGGLRQALMARAEGMDVIALVNYRIVELKDVN